MILLFFRLNGRGVAFWTFICVSIAHIFVLKLLISQSDMTRGYICRWATNVCEDLKLYRTLGIAFCISKSIR